VVVLLGPRTLSTARCRPLAVDRTLSTPAGIALTVSRLRIQGWIMIFPEFQRSHVNTHAASLMLDHAFRLPADGGWGLRRMQWMGACPCACSPLHPDHLTPQPCPFLCELRLDSKHTLTAR
jgi:hypothetical protein